MTTDSGSVFTENTDDAPLNSNVVRRNQDGSHLRICWLQTNLAWTFAVETLQRRLVPTDQRHHDVAGVRHLRLLADHVVSIHDVVLNHGTAFHLEHKRIATARKISK